MVIGIDASRAFRAQKTGTEWYSHELIKAMAQLDCSDTVRLYGVDTVMSVDFALSSAMQYRRLSWPLPRLWTQGRLSWEMLRTPPDVLFVPSHVIPVIHPKKTVTTLHDVGFVHWQQAYTPKEWQYLDWSTRYALKECPRVFTVSEFSRDELVRVYGADPAKIVVTHLGYDATRYAQPTDRAALKAEIVEQYGLDGRYIIMIGRIDRRKNQSLLVKAFEEVAARETDLQLVLVGPLGYRGQEVMDQIALSPYRDRIMVRGWLDEQQKIRLLQGADLMAFPSLYEGFGLPVIEAQACGVPVVAARNSAIPETAGEGAEFFADTSSEECVAAIQRVLSDGLLRNELCATGLRNVQRFSWRLCAEETLRGLREVGI